MGVESVKFKLRDWQHHAKRSTSVCVTKKCKQNSLYIIVLYSVKTFQVLFCFFECRHFALSMAAFLLMFSNAVPVAFNISRINLNFNNLNLKSSMFYHITQFLLFHKHALFCLQLTTYGNMILCIWIDFYMECIIALNILYKLQYILYWWQPQCDCLYAFNMISAINSKLNSAEWTSVTRRYQLAYYTNTYYKSQSSSGGK